MTKHTKYIQAATKKNTGRPPIWIMRQAGRYLPEYRDIRKKHDFLDMVKTPQLACEVTLQPIKRFGLDAAILFSDILNPIEVLGYNLSFQEKIGPVISNPFTAQSNIPSFELEHLRELDYVFEAIQLIKANLEPYNIPLIGFAGAPFTVASYIIEGASSQTLKRTKQALYTDADKVHALLSVLTELTTQYLLAQVRAGANALQIFDTWAIHLSYEQFKEASYPYIKSIIQRVKEQTDIPITLFAKGSSVFFNDLLQTGADVVSIDTQMDLSQAKFLAQSQVALQGNLDPFALYAPDDVLKDTVIKKLTIMKDHPGYIFNLGHGIFPDIDPNKVKLIVDTVKQF